LPHHSKVKRQTLSLAARERKWKKEKRQLVVSGSSTVVEHSHYHSKVNDLSLDASNGRDRKKLAKR
jgi:hypothetical protein